MKNILLLSLIALFSQSCLQNTIDVDYDEPGQVTTSFDIEGKWVGDLVCPSCCSENYKFDLTISNYNESTGVLSAELIITRPATDWLIETYAKYHCTGTFQNNTLQIQTTELYEEESSSCAYCDQNTYQFTLQEDGSLSGDWNNSGTCDNSTISSATITITKQ